MMIPCFGPAPKTAAGGQAGPPSEGGPNEKQPPLLKPVKAAYALADCQGYRNTSCAIMPFRSS